MGLDAEAKLALFSPVLRTICRGQFDGVLDSRSGLIMGDFAYRRHELEVWGAFFLGSMILPLDRETLSGVIANAVARGDPVRLC